MPESSRIKIKMGPVEVEYEGSEGFLKEELLDMVKAVSDLYKESGGKIEPSPPGTGNGNGGGGTGEYVGTTNQIATKIGGSTGPELMRAAGAKLHFVDGKESFTRSELHKEAQSAKSHYKKNYGSNLSRILQSLVKSGDFNEPSASTYALSDTAIKSIGPKIA